MSETTPTDETKNAAREALALTDAEIEALDVMGLFPTDYGMKKPVAWERDATARLSNVVARIKADAVAAALASFDGLRVEVEECVNQPTTCKVWRGDRLVFDGIARAALAPVERWVDRWDDATLARLTLDQRVPIRRARDDLRAALAESKGGDRG